MSLPLLHDELYQLETETFEVEDCLDLNGDALDAQPINPVAITSCSSSTSSCCSTTSTGSSSCVCSTSGTSSCN